MVELIVGRFNFQQNQNYAISINFEINIIDMNDDFNEYRIYLMKEKKTSSRFSLHFSRKHVGNV